MNDELDVNGPLPEGLMLIEASAGTGKTYALIALALRSIAEDDVPISSLCLVTFTDASTNEMRGRLRSSLSQAFAHLSSDDEHHGDTVIDALGADPARRATYADRIARALAELDTAWITTIHGWCARVLASSGVRHGAASALVHHDDDLTEAFHDLIVARYATTGDLPADVGQLAHVVKARMSMPLAQLQRIEPVDVSQSTKVTQRKQIEGLERVKRADEIAGLVDDVVAEAMRRRHERGRQTFDGLLLETRRLLFGPAHHELVHVLRQRFDVVLIDEFQDTDQLQWDIFRRAFHDAVPGAAAPIRRLVLVGDPKQSIYRFRAAELSAYLQARQAAEQQIRTLRVNRRSDPALLEGLGHLLNATTYGDDAVRFEHVRAPEGTPWTSLIDGEVGAIRAALQFRLIDDVAGDMPSLRRAVRHDVVTSVKQLLAGTTRLPDGLGTGGSRLLRAADIAVLTRSNDDATATARDLAAAGVPAATASSNSVLESAAGGQWRVLLTALARPGHLPAVRAAAVGWFFGLALEQLTDDRLLTPDGRDVIDIVHEWSRDLERGGVPRLLRSLADAGWHARLLARIDGERHVTDVEHLAELLQSATSGRPISALAALEHFDSLAAAAEERVTAALLARRMDRDDDAVQVITIHKAKGLEFPVVLCPYLWTNRQALKGLPHAAVSGQRLIDTLYLFDVTDVMRRTLVPVDIEWADEQERRAEERRLAYVALTRARHRCLVWWAQPSTGQSEFRDLVEARGGPGVLAASSAGSVEAVAASSAPPAFTPSVAADAPADLAPATATREHDRRWRIWSFSAIKAAADAAADEVAEMPISGGVDEIDVAAVTDPVASAPIVATSIITPLRDAPGGARFGTAVHRIFERCDFAEPDLLGELTDRSRAELAYRALGIAPETLAHGLVEVIRTPLGGPADLPPLRDLGRHDRLDELDFHLPLGRTTARDVVARLGEHLNLDDPARPWATAVADGALPADIEGRLTGSIDLVARHGPHQQLWIADYKTNRLGPTNGGDPAELIAVMDHAHYWLQATLYLVAAHRYLRWRRRDYDPEQHLVGAAYLFVRAMTPDLPGAGVLWWRPSTAALEAVDRELSVEGGW